MDEVSRLRSQIAMTEARKPDAVKDPVGHRQANEEIAQACDRIRAIQNSYVPRRVV